MSDACRAIVSDLDTLIAYGQRQECNEKIGDGCSATAVDGIGGRST